MQKVGSAPVPLVIYGVPFHNVTFDEAVEWVVERIRSGRPANIATANLDFVMKAWRDPELQRILIDADLVLADGFPIVKLSPFFGPKLKARVTGSDLTPLLAECAAQEGFSLYGLGSAEGVAEKAMEILKARHPDLKVAGTFSPPVAPLLEMDHRDILRRVEVARPDILFVSLGAPKQEKFINMHVHSWNVPVAMGVGASLDFITGEQRRAPLWMRALYLEWFWRICCEPKRLFRRYMENLHFLISATRQMLQIHYMPDHAVSFQPLGDTERQQLDELGMITCHFQPLKTESSVVNFIERLSGLSRDKSILLDAHLVPWFDSLELGALLEINKLCRSRGKRLILYGLRPKVMRLLETCHLTGYFNIASQIDDVDEIIQNLSAHLVGDIVCKEGSLSLKLPMELTTATLPFFKKEVEQIRQEGLKTIEIDAAQLGFIDTAGLVFLMKLKNLAEDNGASMSISNLSPKPRRTFEIARVDKILLQA